MKPLIARAARKGAGATILAYGQTGSGKTHTVMGDGGEGEGEDATAGIVPRVVDELYRRCGSSNVSATYVQGRAFIIISDERPNCFKDSKFLTVY